MLQAVAFVAEQFQDPRRDIGAFGVQHGVVIGEGHLFEDAFGAVLVEGRPNRRPGIERSASNLARGGNTRRGAREYRVGDLAQGQQDHGGVIDVRIPLVVELENPAAGLDVGGILVMPIAAKPDFAGRSTSQPPSLDAG